MPNYPTQDIIDLINDVKDTAHAMLKDHDNYGEDLDTTRGPWQTVAWNVHGPHLPPFNETRPDAVSYPDWFSTMPVVLDLWHSSTNPEGKNDITVQVKDIALVHFNER